VPTTTVVLAGCSVMFAMTESAPDVVTEIVALADFPAVVAVTVVEPTATAVTAPVALTVATVVAELDHVNTFPLKTSPAALSAEAPNVVVAPIGSDTLLGVIVTLATTVSAAGGVTLIEAAPEMPLVVAVIVALPAATAVATPAAVTETMFVAELDHVNVWPTTSTPAAFSAVARSVRLAPTAMEADGGSIATCVTRLSGTTLVRTGSSLPQAAATKTARMSAKREFSTRARAVRKGIGMLL